MKIRYLLSTTLFLFILQVDWYAKMMPFEEMTMEDFFDYYPDHPQNMYKYPNFWPHTDPPRPVFPYLEKKEEH